MTEDDNQEVLKLVVEANAKLHELRIVAREKGLNDVASVALRSSMVLNDALLMVAKDRAS